MVKFRHFIIISLVLVLGIILFKYLSPAEDKKIKKSFKLLCQYVEKRADENLLSSVNRIKNISRLFLNPCIFKIEDDPFYSLSGSFTREEIEGYALKGRAYFSRLSLEFDDFKIEFPERNLAHVHVRGRLKGRSKVGEDVDEVRELFCILHKVKDAWLFQQFEVTEVLKK